MSTNVKKIAVMGMLLAAQVVAGMFFSIKLQLVTIGFIFLPLSITGMLYGPLWGAAAGVMGDFLIAALGPYGYYPPMATTAFLSGLIYGLFLYKKPAALWRSVSAVLIITVFLNMGLNTLWLWITVGDGVWGLFLSRLPKYFVVAPVQILVTRLLSGRLAAVFRRMAAA